MEQRQKTINLSHLSHFEFQPSSLFTKVSKSVQLLASLNFIVKSSLGINCYKKQFCRLHLLIVFNRLTRMHSSRMRTARSSSHPGGSAPGTPRTRHPPGPGTPLGADPLQQAPPRPGTLPPGAAPWTRPPWTRVTPVNRILDTRL